MAEYSLDFAKKLADTAIGVVADGIIEIDAQRTVLYLGYLSSEIALKALLEKSGKPVAQIRARSHRLNDLLKDIDGCDVEIEIEPSLKRWLPASELRAQVVDDRFPFNTVGMLLEAKKDGRSQYPNQVRYGDFLKDFPAEMIARMAKVICDWADKHWNTIRVRVESDLD